MRRYEIFQGPSLSGVMLTSGRRGMPFVPGVLFILLAVVVLIAPKLVFGAIAVVLLSLGLLFCYVAYRVVKLKRQLADMARDIEKRFTAQGFPLERPDIDITDLEDKKIVIH